jgi:hypothetical protein
VTLRGYARERLFDDDIFEFTCLSATVSCFHDVEGDGGDGEANKLKKPE